MPKKWSSELAKMRVSLTLLKSIKPMLNNIPLLRKESTLLISSIIDKTRNSIVTIQSTMVQKNHHSFFDFRLNEIDELIKACLILIDPYIKALDSVEELSKQHAESISRARTYYDSSKNFYCSIKKNPLFTSEAFTLFEHNVTAQLITWHNLRKRLETLNQITDEAKASHNTLTRIFTPDDTQFLKMLDDCQLAIGSELGHLIIQRLKNIAISRSVTPRMRVSANMWLQIQTQATTESIYYYDVDEFKSELIKLALYALSYPDQKIAWLGTARAVNTYALKYPLGMYLNCDDKNWSWQLNRSWMQAALILGYRLQLVEQHFPHIESAILSGDATKFIEQLARETRKPGHVSQYNGDDQPTATSQEVLALMSMGCYAEKSDGAGNSGSILFHSPRLKVPDIAPLSTPKRGHIKYGTAAIPSQLTQTTESTTTDSTTLLEPELCFTEQDNILLKELATATTDNRGLSLAETKSASANSNLNAPENMASSSSFESCAPEQSNLSLLYKLAKSTELMSTNPAPQKIIVSNFTSTPTTQNTSFDFNDSSEPKKENSDLNRFSFFAEKSTTSKLQLSHSQTIYCASLPPLNARRDNFTIPGNSADIRASTYTQPQALA